MNFYGNFFFSHSLNSDWTETHHSVKEWWNIESTLSKLYNKMISQICSIYNCYMQLFVIQFFVHSFDLYKHAYYRLLKIPLKLFFSTFQIDREIRLFLFFSLYSTYAKYICISINLFYSTIYSTVWHKMVFKIIVRFLSFTELEKSNRHNVSMK